MQRSGRLRKLESLGLAAERGDTHQAYAPQPDGARLNRGPAGVVLSEEDAPTISRPHHIRFPTL